MPIITARFYPSVAHDMFMNTINDGDIFKVALLNEFGVYVATHTSWSELLTHEISDPSYVNYAQKTATITAAVVSGVRSTFAIAPIQWNNATFTFRHVVIYAELSGRLLMHLTFDVNQVVSGQNYQINSPSPLPNAILV